MMILQDICLKPFTTLGVKVRAKTLIAISLVEDLRELKSQGKLDNQQVMILGEGSNVLFSKHYEGLILLNQIRGHEVIEETDEHVFLKINGGENWSRLVDFAVAKNWGGVENLSLIPGTAGAAPIQNIGAYGVELQDVFDSLTAFDLKTGELVKFNKESCEFGYRDSIFKTKFPGRYFITDITLKLVKKPIPNLEYAPLKAEFNGRTPGSISILEISDAVKKIRRSKLPDPSKIGNAGSFFKNPFVSEDKMNELKILFPEIPVYSTSDGNYKLAAGWLIEQCGWKGKRIGDAGVHEKQALVLVNYGNSTGGEIL
ncbi:MAG TPA: UDP-N-acetylmuramate dehydrogenase, partial [Bacteroidales bacterium]